VEEGLHGHSLAVEETRCSDAGDAMGCIELSVDTLDRE
jgi:hypothetical protein